MIWWVAAVVIAIDQLTKYWAVQVLYHQNRTIVVIESFFQLAYAENQGGVAGLMSSHPQILTLLSLVALAVIVWWARTIPPSEKIARLGFGFVLGGAAGNLIDRLFRGGLFFDTYVVDFLDAHWRYRIHWPTFNLADCGICLGIGLILIAHFRGYDPSANAKDGEASNEPERTASKAHPPPR